MIQLLLILAGGALGACIAMRLYRGADQWRVTAVNCAVCTLLGGVEASDQLTGTYLGVFLAQGLLITAAPMCSVLLPYNRTPDRAQAWPVVRRAARGLVVNSVYGCAFATLGYIVVFSIVSIAYKLTW